MVNRSLRAKVRRDVRRQWPQFAAVTVTILLGVALFTASSDAYRNLQASYDALFARTGFPDLWVVGGNVAGFADGARTTDGVATVALRTEVDVPLRIGDRKLEGRLVSLPEAPVGGVSVLSGRSPQGDGVAIEQHVAGALGIGPGDAVEIGSATGGYDRVDVQGVVASAEYLWPARSRQEILTLPQNFGVLFAAPPTVRTLTGVAPNQALVQLAPGADADRILPDLRAQARRSGAGQVYDRSEQPSNSVLSEDLAGFNQLSVAFPALFLTAAALATYVLLTRRVQRERELIGTLAALGVDRRTILGHYLTYGGVAGALGAALGSGVGLLAARSVTRLYTDVIDLPSTVYALRGATILTGVAFGIGTGLLAALVPARSAAAVAPAEAMRGIVPVSGGRRSLIERLVPPLRRAPATWRLVLRNVGRSRRRTAMTVVGTMLALLLVVTSWAMLDTMTALIDTQFGVVDRQDATVALAPDGAPTSLEQVSGVAVVEPMAEVPVTLRSGDAAYATSLRVLPRATRLQGLPSPDGEAQRLPDEGVLVGDAARDLLGITAGERVTVEVAAARRRPAEPPAPSVRTTVRGFVQVPMGTYAYASFKAAAALGISGPDAALLTYAEGADPDAVRQRITDLPSVAAVTDTRAVQRLVDDFVGLFRAVVGGMLALGGLMAFAIIFTTMSVNVLERSREVATLRAGGVRGSTLGRLITAENLLVTVAGVVPGLVVGVLGAATMLRFYSNDQFALSLTVRPSTLALSALAIVGVAALSQWPGLRAVRRLDISAVVRERQT